VLTLNVCYRFCFSQNWNIHGVICCVDLYHKITYEERNYSVLYFVCKLNIEYLYIYIYIKLFIIMKLRKFIATTIREYLNEQILNYIQWGELSTTIKNDITENLIRKNEYLQSNYWNSEALRDIIDDVIIQPRFKIEHKSVDGLYNELTQIGWGISEKNVKKLINILSDGTELDPIILNNGNFFDGGHRLTAYKRLRKEMIPTIDIGFLLNFDWEKWDNDEVDFKSF